MEVTFEGYERNKGAKFLAEKQILTPEACVVNSLRNENLPSAAIFPLSGVVFVNLYGSVTKGSNHKIQISLEKSEIDLLFYALNKDITLEKFSENMTNFNKMQRP